MNCLAAGNVCDNSRSFNPGQSPARSLRLAEAMRQDYGVAPDRCFIKEMSDPTTATIVRSTIDLGHRLGLKVVAEGVEDEVDLRTLRLFGCDQAQGYFMSRPLPAKELEEWLRYSPWDTALERGVPSASSEGYLTDPGNRRLCSVR